VVDHIQNTPYGVSGASGADELVIGNTRMMEDQGIRITPAFFNQLKIKSGQTPLFLAKNKKIVGYFVLSDPLRVEAYDTVQALRKLGKKVYICTGADKKTAYRYAQLLGIPQDNDHVFAEHVAMISLDEKDPSKKDKASCIKALRAQKLKVAMVGDSENDTLAIKQADIGIAIKNELHSSIPEQEAGVVLHKGSLLSVLNTFLIARQTMRNIKQNLWISFGYNMG
jgi:Cu2+-exporting ATPase